MPYFPYFTAYSIEIDKTLNLLRLQQKQIATPTVTTVAIVTNNRLWCRFATRARFFHSLSHYISHCMLFVIITLHSNRNGTNHNKNTLATFYIILASLFHLKKKSALHQYWKNWRGLNGLFRWKCHQLRLQKKVLLVPNNWNTK